MEKNINPSLRSGFIFFSTKSKLKKEGVIPMITDIMKFTRKTGKMPDKFYYQVNGKSAQENYADIREKRKSQSAEKPEPPEETYNIKIKSEVKIK